MQLKRVRADETGVLFKDAVIEVWHASLIVVGVSSCSYHDPTFFCLDSIRQIFRLLS